MSFLFLISIVKTDKDNFLLKKTSFLHHPTSQPGISKSIDTRRQRDDVTQRVPLTFYTGTKPDGSEVTTKRIAVTAPIQPITKHWLSWDRMHIANCKSLLRNVLREKSMRIIMNKYCANLIETPCRNDRDIDLIKFRFEKCKIDRWNHAKCISGSQLYNSAKYYT